MRITPRFGAYTDKDYVARSLGQLGQRGDLLLRAIHTQFSRPDLSRQADAFSGHYEIATRSLEGFRLAVLGMLEHSLESPPHKFPARTFLIDQGINKRILD